MDIRARLIFSPAALMTSRLHFSKKSLFVILPSTQLTTPHSYATALQTVALFGFNLKRIPALLGFIAFLVVTGTLIVPDKTPWLRNSVNFIVRIS